MEVYKGLQDHYHIYTGGSRMSNLVAAALWDGMSQRAYVAHDITRR